MRFTLPRGLYHSEHTLDASKTLTGKKAFIIVGGGSMKHFGLLGKVVNYLKEAGMEAQLFEGAELDPPVETIMKGAKATEEFNPDWIVAMGDGSPIDTAKTTWTLYEYPDTSFEDPIIPSNFPTLRTKAKSCAIPSTSDTATEVTTFSVITDYSKGTKYPPADFNITPDVVIIDPALAETMSRKLTAHTGMDTTTHAIRAYMSTLNYEYTGLLALHTIETTNGYLIPSYNGDMEAHDKMHNTQYLAGMASSNALLGIVYSMAHKTDAAYSGGHIVHGCANAIYLPKVIKYNSKEPEVAARYTETAKSINLPGTTSQELIDALTARIYEMNEELDIPTCIKDHEDGIIDEKGSMEKLPAVAKSVVGDTYTGSNPRSIIPAQMEKLLTCCFYDEEVTF